MRPSQEEYIISLLKSYGTVSRNHCLEQRITRLASIISGLNNEENGWEIKGQYVKKNGGKDFVYSVVKMPFKKVTYHVEGVGNISRFENVKS